MDKDSTNTTTSNGPWGPAGDVCVFLSPLVMLVFVSVYGKGMPAFRSLPIAALYMIFIVMAYQGAPTQLVFGSIIQGTLDSFTPISIIGGAMFLFETMDASGSMAWIAQTLKLLTRNKPIPQVMLIAWAFAYLVEGASGFGTPVIIASRLLKELGHDPISALCCCLVMNTLATPFGAAGTPMWFGFSPERLGLSDEELSSIGLRVAVLNGICALIVPILALRMLVPWHAIRSEMLFVYLSILSCVLPSIGLAVFSLEFPSLIGGMVGTLVTAALIQYEIGHTSNGFLVQNNGSIPNGKSNGYISDHIRNTTINGRKGEEQAEEPRKLADNGDGEITDVTIGDGDGGIADVASGNVDVQGQQPYSISKGSGDSKIDAVVQLSKLKAHSTQFESPLGTKAQVVWFTLPITLTVFILLITRVPQFGLKSLLQSATPRVSAGLGSLGVFSLSAALVLKLENIAENKEINWTYQTLYVPALLPFITVSTLVLCGCAVVPNLLPPGAKRQNANNNIQDNNNNDTSNQADERSEDEEAAIHDSADNTKKSKKTGITFVGFRKTWLLIARRVRSRLLKPLMALIGALILVSLFRVGDPSPAFVVGNTLADALQGGWLALSVGLGAIGSFFSGSTTVSNLTFGSVQQSAANQLDIIGKEGMLALQTVGATMGNMVCLNNIVNAKVVIGLDDEPEGVFIKRSAYILLVYYLVATSMGVLLFVVVWP